MKLYRLRLQYVTIAISERLDVAKIIKAKLEKINESYEGMTIQQISVKDDTSISAIFGLPYNDLMIKHGEKNEGIF